MISSFTHIVVNEGFHPSVYKCILFGHTYSIFCTYSSVDDVGHFLGILSGDAYECKDVSLINRFNFLWLCMHIGIAAYVAVLFSVFE